MSGKIIKGEDGWIDYAIDEWDKAGVKFYDVLTNPESIEIEYPGRKVSDKPMFSKGYEDCNGVVLLGNKHSGLTHYSLAKGVPEIYLQKLINEMTSLTNVEELTAVLVGGDFTHFNRNKKFLEDYEIPIIGQYLEKHKGRIFPKRYRKKDLAVMPKTKEVIICIAANYFKQLA